MPNSGEQLTLGNEVGAGNGGREDQIRGFDYIHNVKQKMEANIGEMLTFDKAGMIYEC